jgi:hypothetical protein
LPVLTLSQLSASCASPARDENSAQTVVSTAPTAADGAVSSRGRGRVGISWRAGAGRG